MRLLFNLKTLKFSSLFNVLFNVQIFVNLPSLYLLSKYNFIPWVQIILLKVKCWSLCSDWLWIIKSLHIQYTVFIIIVSSWLVGSLFCYLVLSYSLFLTWSLFYLMGGKFGPHPLMLCSSPGSVLSEPNLIPEVKLESAMYKK